MMKVAQILSVLFFLIGSFYFGETRSEEPKKKEKYAVPPLDSDLTDLERGEILREIRQNENLLLQRRIIRKPYAANHPLFTLPIKRAPGFKDPDFWSIAYQVDQDPEYPDQLLDYNGGARTYDTPEGYNHQGTDFYSWPFAWAKFYLTQVQAIAAAPGVILAKQDGNYDRDCNGFNSPDQANYVILRHDDGSQSWYLHLKKYSVTIKNVGDNVARGEFLGNVGSSGISTAPHLHFEVHDSADRLIDPFSGSFNRLNADSWWQQQPPYNDFAINKIMTHMAPPDFRGCSRIELIHASNQFRPGDRIFFAAYFRDVIAGKQVNFSVLDSGGRLFASWIRAGTADRVVSYWLKRLRLPADASKGNWKFKAVVDRKILLYTFRVLDEIRPLRVTSLLPETIRTGTAPEIQLLGNGFQKGMAVSLYNRQWQEVPVTVNEVAVQSSTVARVKLTVDANAAPGPIRIVITRRDYVQCITSLQLN